MSINSSIIQHYNNNNNLIIYKALLTYNDQKRCETFKGAAKNKDIMPQKIKLSTAILSQRFF
jgi:hypothetical protein